LRLHNLDNESLTRATQPDAVRNILTYIAVGACFTSEEADMFANMESTLDQTHSPFPVRVLNRWGRWVDGTSLDFPHISPEHLIADAQRHCGLDDFGEDDFVEPLSRLVKSCVEEGRLNLIGKFAFRSDLFRTLCNRLLIQRDRQIFPKISRQQIKEPLFIVGLPRSGTTLLHTLLACDPNHRAPLTWEVMQPSPPSHDGRRQRARRAAINLGCLRWLAPTFRQVHAIGAELPQECVSLMSPSFMSDQFDTMYYVPSYRTWFLKQDLLPAYRYHRRFLQHLQQRQRARRWVLKAPAHMFALPALLSTYPDARFVQTHRDPLQAITSVSSLIAILRRVFSDAVDPFQIGRDAIRYWSETLLAFLQERDRFLRGRICDLHYSEIRRDPITAIRRVYRYFGWSLSLEAERRMRVALSNQPREQHGSHRYNAAQFGLDTALEADCFTAYCDRFGLTSATRIVQAERAA
jgi:hypothetical protein